MATTEIKYWDSRSLSAAVTYVKAYEQFILKSFFSKRESHPTDRIDIVTKKGLIKNAKFSTPKGSAKLIENAKEESVSQIRLPKTFEKKIFEAEDLAKFKQFGNTYISTPEERVQAANQAVVEELQEIKERVIRLQEWMACQALVYGKIDVDQDDLKFKVDYNFVAGKQLLELTGTSKWGTAGVDPAIDIRKWRRLIASRTGRNAKIMIVGSETADILLSDANVKKQLDNSYNKAGALDLTADFETTGTWLGNLSGVSIYEYTQQYVSEAGTETDLIPATQAILVAPTTDFRHHFGPVYRIKNNGLNVINTDILIQAKTDDDEAIMTWTGEHKSLPAIHMPELIISAKVK